MRLRQIAGSVFKIGVLVVCAYIAINWRSIGSPTSDVETFARSACVDATEARFDVTNVRVYDLAENTNGFTARVSVTLPNGERAKVVCLTSPQGTVRDVTIDVR